MIYNYTSKEKNKENVMSNGHNIKCHDITMTTCHPLPHSHEKAPDFSLVDPFLDTVTLDNFQHNPLLIFSYPSIDTQTGFDSLGKIKALLKERHATVIGVSNDLPFTLQRCIINDAIEDVILLSDFRDHTFGKNYGVEIADGALRGFLSSALFILDKNHHLVYSELLTNVENEPDYQAALTALDHGCH